MEKELESQYKHQNIELIKMCEHEVSVKNRRTQSYRWLICGCIITEKPIVKEKYYDKKVLLVTHGGTSRAIEAYFKGCENGIMPPETLQNCEIREYEYID